MLCSRIFVRALCGGRMINPLRTSTLDKLFLHLRALARPGQRVHVNEPEQFICGEIDKIRAEVSNLSKRVYELETKGRDE